MERKIEFETWTFIDLVLTDIQKLICGYLVLGGALAISSSTGLPDKFFKNHYFEQNNGIVVTLVFFVCTNEFDLFCFESHHKRRTIYLIYIGSCFAFRISDKDHHIYEYTGSCNRMVYIQSFAKVLYF